MNEKIITKNLPSKKTNVHSISKSKKNFTIFNNKLTKRRNEKIKKR